MRRTSPFHGLKWLVEVRVTGGGGGQWWEAICAFNHDEVAKRYADDCADGHSRSGPDFAYRVRERRGNKWVVVHETAPSKGRVA